MVEKTSVGRSTPRPRIFRIREVDVILDADLAEALGLPTKRLNERIMRNADLFDDRHGFHLTQEEFAALRSQIATSSSTWGGRRHPPRVFTDRGVARVSTFINTPEALRAADLIVDTFLTVQKQIAAGRKRIEIEQPSRYHLMDDLASEAQALKKRLVGALNALLDAVIDIKTGQTVSETTKELTAEAIGHFRERLREKGLENLKLEAETRKILAEAEKLAAEIRRADAETESLRLDNLTKRIALVRDLITLQREIEPLQLVRLLDTFDSDRPFLQLEAPPPAAVRRLPPPRHEDH